MAAEEFDVIVLGGGPAGEMVTYPLGGAGKRVAVVERELIEGECAYWACNPTKTLLRPVSLWGETVKCFGTREVELDWPATSEYRNEMVRHYDDSVLVGRLEDAGATVIRADGRLDGAGRVRAGDLVLTAPDVVIATGSEPVIPQIDGLSETGYWTNREATAVTSIPKSVLVVGGGPSGVELGQFMRRFGADATIVERRPVLLPREEPELGDHLLEALRADGIDVRLHTSVDAVRRDGGSVVSTLSDGSRVRTDEIVVVTGRRPRTSGIGLETVGLEPGAALPADEWGRVGDGLWAIGDVAGPPFFTHRAMYHARCVAANILEPTRPIDERAIPRAIFTDPEVAAVGATEASATERGLSVRTASLPFEELDRPYTYQTDWTGICKLIVDADSGEVLGAAAAGPLVSEWIHVASVAIKARLHYRVLKDLVIQFPTFVEAFWHLGEELDRAED